MKLTALSWQQNAKVPMERFNGKKVIECQVSDGISKAEELLNRAMSGDVLVYHASGAGESSSSTSAKSGGSLVIEFICS